MKKVEGIGLIIISALLFQRIFVGMGFYVMLRILLTLLSIFYMWFGFFLFNDLKMSDLFFRQKRKNLSRTRVFSSIFSGFLYSYCLITLMFVISFYSGMHTMIIIALLLNLALLFYSYYQLQSQPTHNKYYRQYFIRSSVFAVLFLSLWLVPREEKLNILFRDHPSFIEAYKNYQENPDDPQNLQRLKEERSAFR